ncbi:hypothetical protein ACPWSR_04880 [Alloiococcus sp. CFN-8]|uniref:hypothetical protein n=1 Tax=Alloiococcus sp. CFN-8 TaxID=3416081 RepID=UPI003CEB263C
MYEITINPVKKEVYAFAEGFFTLEEANSFIADFKSKTSNINTSGYNLIVNTKELKTCTPEVAAKLADVMAMYIENPYKGRYIVKLESVVTQSQVNRLGKSIPGFIENVVFVDDENEARRLIG